MNESKVCQSCGGINSIEAAACKYCGNSLFKIKKSKFLLTSKDNSIEIVSDFFIERKNFSSKFISNKHAYLYIENDKLMVRDLSSTNGTFINGEKMTPLEDYELKDEDTITFADLKFTVEVIR